MKTIPEILAQAAKDAKQNDGLISTDTRMWMNQAKLTTQHVRDYVLDQQEV